MLADIDRVIETGRATQGAVQQQYAASIKRGDPPEKIGCLGRVRSQVVAELGNVLAIREIANKALGQGDQEAARNSVADAQVKRERLRQLEAEATQCAGSSPTDTGASTEVTISDEAAFAAEGFAEDTSSVAFGDEPTSVGDDTVNDTGAGTAIPQIPPPASPIS